MLYIYAVPPYSATDSISGAFSEVHTIGQLSELSDLLSDLLKQSLLEAIHYQTL